MRHHVWHVVTGTRGAEFAAAVALAVALTFGTSALWQQHAFAEEPNQQVAALETTGDILIGYGLIVGLNGTGDSEIDQELVESSIVGVLKRAGLDIWGGQIRPGRVAKVVISAKLPSSFREGSRLDVSITAIGNAASLAGGTLLATPLRDANGKVYAVGRGQIAIGKQPALAHGQSQQFEIGGRGGTLAEGVVLNSRHVQELAAE